MAVAIPLALAAAGAGAGVAAGASTLATVGLAASLASAGIGAVGAMNNAAAQSGMENYNAQVAANNATIAKQNAAWATQSGEEQAATSEQKTRATVGGILANEGASGVDVNQGSSVDVRSSAASLGELDAINIRANAARQAYGYNVQSQSETDQSQLDRYAAANDQSAGEVSAASTLIGGVGSAGSSLAQYNMNNSMINAAMNPATATGIASP